MSCELCQRKLIVCRHCQQSSEEWRKEGRKKDSMEELRDTRYLNWVRQLQSQAQAQVCASCLGFVNCFQLHVGYHFGQLTCHPSQVSISLPALATSPPPSSLSPLAASTSLLTLSLLPLLYFSISAGILWRHYCPAKTEVLKPFFLSLCLHCCASHPLLCFPSLSLSLSLCLALPHLCCLYFS